VTNYVLKYLAHEVQKLKDCGGKMHVQAPALFGIFFSICCHTIAVIGLLTKS
jgi:hypothetical protein